MTPYVPDDAPFSNEQRAWLNGFLAGLFSTREVDAGDGAPSTPARPLLVLYGSQTGTAEGLARKAAKQLAAAGFAPNVAELDAVDPAALADEERVLVVTSTYGDGEMPDNAELFWDALSADDAPRLEATAFSVFALGDSSYVDFCKAGRDLDARLETLGARRLHPRVDADVDVDEPFAAWLDGVVEALAGEGAEQAPLALAA